MAFVRDPASLVQGHDAGTAGPWQALPPEASLGATCPKLETSCQVHRVMSVDQDAFPYTQSPPQFPRHHTYQHISHPVKAECPGKK